MLKGLLGQFSIVLVPAHRYYRDLLVARLISALGTWTAFFAVRIALYNQTKSPVWITVLLFSELAPGVILGLTLGPLIDRWPRQRMMILSDLGGVVAFGALPFVHSPGGICAVSAFAGFSAAFFRPGCYSAIPNLLPEDAVMAGNALMQGVENLCTLLGPVLAALGVITIGAHSVYALNALSFLFSALLLVRIGNRLQSDVPARIGRAHWREVRSGFSLVRDNTYLSSIFLIWSWATLAYTGINVAEIVLAKSPDQGYGTGSLGFGIFVAASALGSVVGSVVAKWFIDRLGVYGGYRASFLITAAGVAVCAVSPGLVIGCAGAVVYGIGNGVGLVCNVTLIQQVVPDHRRGQIFAVLGSLVQTFTLAGTLAAGPITDAIGPRLTWGIAAALLGLGYLNAVFVTSLRARRERRDSGLVAPGPAAAAPTNGGTHRSAVERIGSLLEEVERTHEAEEARGFVTRSRRLHAGSRRRRRG
jgi:DHA3 family macrolide efflux protein-like MFS transporter